MRGATRRPTALASAQSTGEDFYRAALEAGDDVRCERDWAVSPGDGVSWQHSAALLDMLGAFPGDKTMTHAPTWCRCSWARPTRSCFPGTTPSSSCAALGRRQKWANAEPYAERAIDFAHCFCDQHVTRGIGYAALTMSATRTGFPGGTARRGSTWPATTTARTPAPRPERPGRGAGAGGAAPSGARLLRKRPGHRAPPAGADLHPRHGPNFGEIHALHVDIGTLAAGVGVLGPLGSRPPSPRTRPTAWCTRRTSAR